jgi:putative transposase
MNTLPATNPYKRHRFPAEIISHSVWLYYRFSLSYRDVEELMVERGVTLSHEVVRYWCRKFGQAYTNALRRRRPRPGDTWHDEGANARAVIATRDTSLSVTVLSATRA